MKKRNQWYHLHQAVIHNDVVAIQALIAEDVDLDATAYEDSMEYINYGCTPLVRAISLNHLEIAYLLIEANASVNRTKPWSDSPLELAARAGHNELVKALLEKGANVNEGADEFPLYHAVNNRDLGLVKLLIRSGADVNQQHDGGFSSLMRAAQLGYLEIVEYLVSAGANVDLRDKVHSALNYAASAGQVAVFEYLAPLSHEQWYCNWLRDVILSAALKKKEDL